MTTLLGITAPAPGDWHQGTIAHLFQVAIAFLGDLGGRVRGLARTRRTTAGDVHRRPSASAGGFLVGCRWVSTARVLARALLGYGVLGGIGLGLGYISPVSTLIKWFPDRPGMATGLAIMGFGGGAMIASPLSVALMAHFKSATSMGVAETFVTMGLIYFVVHDVRRVHRAAAARRGGRRRATCPTPASKRMITTANVEVGEAIRTPQFWLLWTMLCVNVTAGIGILEQASPMIQEMFSGAVTAVVAGGFVGLLSLRQHGRAFLLVVVFGPDRPESHLRARSSCSVRRST